MYAGTAHILIRIDHSFNEGLGMYLIAGYVSKKNLACALIALSETVLWVMIHQVG